LAKPFNPVFLRARIGACLEKKHLRDREQETYRALVESQKKLAAELAEAATYVKSLLPQPLQGAVSAEWCFHPSTQLGGDAFGYHWLDEDHFAIYLLDVCGHGVGAALLSVSVSDVLRAETLPATDFRDPVAVLAGLNRTFKMENHNNMYFTAWYGVYNKPKRELVYASGGHPPAVLLTGDKAGTSNVIELRTHAPAIGCFEDAKFVKSSQVMGPFAKLFVLSDGVYEVAKPDGTMMKWAEFVEHIVQSSKEADFHPDKSLQFVQRLSGAVTLEDDFSLVKLSFN
jgi:phosphoserine phosphatase RsbU/P